MTGMAGPQGTGTWRFRRIYALSVAFVATVALLLFAPLGSAAHQVISGVGLIGGGIIVVIACLIQRSYAAGSRRRAWNWFVAAALLGTLSNTWVGIFGRPDNVKAFSPGDMFVLLALVVGIAGTSIFPSRPRRSTDIARMVLDGTVFGGSVLLLLSVTVFPQILAPPGSTIVDRALTLLVPTADIVLVTVAVLLLFRAAPSDRPFFILCAAGFVFFAVSDLAYAVLTSRSPFENGSLYDLGWVAGYALLANGALQAKRRSAETDEPAETSAVIGTLAMFTLFLTAMAISLNAWRLGTLSVASAVLWLLILVAVAARQHFLILDNEHLRRTLELRVERRTDELRVATRRTALLLNSVGDGIYGVDSDGRVTFVNPVGARVLGYPEDELIGQLAHQLFHAAQIDGTPYPESGCYITEAIREGRATNAEDDVYVREDGLSIPVEVTASPLADGERIIGAVVAFRDVTQRREMDRMKNEFVSMVSHELRTPLTSIRGSLGLLNGGALGPLSASASKMVGIALDSSERLTRLINEILDIERIESGAMPMDPARHRARALIESAFGQVHLLATEAEVNVCLGHMEGVVMADADRVTQTLINLLGNAIKFSPPGSRVDVSSRARGQFIEFKVADRGRGIPADKLDSIFVRFEQVDSSDAREKGGSGLGLAISRSIVERSGGRIWAENNPDQGATFWFTIPQALVSSDESTPVKTSGGPLAAAHLKRNL